MTLDLATGAGLMWSLLPEIVLSVWAMAVLLAGVWMEGGTRDAGDRATPLGSLALVGLLAAAVMNGWLHGVSAEGVAGGMIVLDRFRLFANWIFLLGAALTILMSFPFVARQRLQPTEFYALVLLATVGMMLMAGTRNLILLFLALETMSISAYVLTAYDRRDGRSAEAGIKYFVLGAFSSGFLLYGIALVWGATGSVDLVEVAARIQAGAGLSGLLAAGMGLLGVGFAFKVGAVPFHMWTPDVYEGAPTPSTAFMAAAVKAASFAAFLRVFLTAFPAMHDTWYPVVWWLAALSMVGANLVALAQTNVKRMLAYSSLAHGGYLLVGLAAANDRGASAILFYLLVYTIMTVGAFGVVTISEVPGEDRLDLEEYSGMGWSHPILGVILTIFLLSLAGFPGTGGFMAKIFLLQGAAESRLWALAILLALTTVVSYYYYLRVAWYMWMRPARATGADGPVLVPLTMLVALVGCAAALVFLGIFPTGVLEGALTAAAGLAGR